jgi:hypothetical protein
LHIFSSSSELSALLRLIRGAHNKAKFVSVKTVFSMVG